MKRSFSLLSLVLFSLLLGSCTTFGVMMCGGEQNFFVIKPTLVAKNDTGVSLSTTGCVLGQNPRFVQSYGRNASTGVSLTTDTKFLPPAGYQFCELVFQVTNKGPDAIIDLNKTSLTTAKGMVCLPFYAQKTVQLSTTSVKDILPNPKKDETMVPFEESIPGTKRQIFLYVWYAIKLDDTPASIDVLGTRGDFTQYSSKTK